MAQPTQNKQWLTNQDGLDKLHRGEGTVPQPGEKEVLVKIQAVSLNYRDTEVANGLYNHHKSLDENNKSLVLASDMCGIIVEAGPGASLKEGQRVLSIFLQTHQTGGVQESDMASGMGLPLEGVLQEYRVFPDTALVIAPDYMSNEEAATLPIAGTTAFMAMNWMQPMGRPITNPETTVLFQVRARGLQVDTQILSSGHFHCRSASERRFELRATYYCKSGRHDMLTILSGYRRSFDLWLANRQSMWTEG
jgi:NADPH:quinone reductase-like Zn-dependent oxidoreductase